MPASALVTAAIEQSINRLLHLDPDTSSRLRGLAGARFTLYLDVLPYGITLCFSEQVDVLAETQSFDALTQALPRQHCVIKTQLSVLPALAQSSQITRLIQQGQLALEGELNVAQQVSGLFQQLDIDWEEQLAQHTGDVFAHTAFSATRKMAEQVSGFLSRAGAGLGNALVEEKKLAAHRLAVMHFSDQVSELRDDVERAEARLRQLEKQYEQS